MMPDGFDACFDGRYEEGESFACTCFGTHKKVAGWPLLAIGWGIWVVGFCEFGEEREYFRLYR